MAKQPAASSRAKAPSTAAAATTRGASARSGASRAVTVPSPEDLEHAKDDALLQLRIGRSAHLFAVGISAALAFAGILVLLVDPSGAPTTNGASGVAEFGNTFYLAVVVLAGLAIAAVALVEKWEEYALWPWEVHFSTTVGAVGVNALLAVVYFTRVAGVGPFATLPLVPWFYPAALAGITLAFLGLALTWTGWGARQWGSAVGAVLPLVTSALLFVRPLGSATGSDALAISLFLSAIFFQTSGSFLHLISSGTRVHERELITSGQSRMFRFADELREKGDALRFRETALVKREATVETGEMSIRRQNDALQEARSQLDGLEEDYRKRSDEVLERERQWASRVAEVDGKTRLIDDKLKMLEMREQEVARLVPQISAREARLVTQEGAQTQRNLDLNHQKEELDRRDAGLAESEARLEARRKVIDQKTVDLLRREGEVTARGSGAATGGASTSLADREAKLAQLKTVLDEQNLALGRRARDATDLAKKAETAYRQLSQKESDLAARDASLRQREADIADRLQEADERRAQYQKLAKEYETAVASFGQQQADTVQQKADLDRASRSMVDRESSIGRRETELKARLDELDRREGDLLARERTLESDEAEAQLRRQAALRGGDLPIAGLAAVAAADSLDRPSGARGPGEIGVRDVSGLSAPETLRASGTRRLPDRVPSGTPRLDDLLLGGLPTHGHTVLLGDAFVGKEVVLYSFVAEGLKRGEPTIIITASRPPEEISENLGVVLPQFREYEQMGMVTWVDAAGGSATPEPRRLVVKGPDDRAGILSSLVQAAKGAEDGGSTTALRVGFLGLSAVMAHVDERTSFSFLQNVVGILKPRNALAMYSLEGGVISEAQVEALLGRMDGAIVFRQDRGKTFLSVKGFGEAQTRDWVECRATNRALIVGSFALERIR